MSRCDGEQRDYMRIGVNATHLGTESHPLDEWYLRNLLHKVTELQPSIRFVVFTSEKSHGMFEGHDRLLVEKTMTVGRLFRSSSRPLESAIAKVGVDCVFSAMEFGPVKSSAPCVAYALDPYDIETKATQSDRAARQAIENARQTCAAARTVIAPSAYVRDALLKALGVAINKVQIAPPGVDDIATDPQPTFVDPPYFLIAGGAVAASNAGRVVEAFRRLQDELPHSLVVYGPAGSEERATWGDRVLRIERCPTAHLTALYQHCAVCICPALHDGAGLGVLRALRAGARVIAGRVGGVPAAAGNTPIYCNPDSDASIATAIRRALEESPEERDAAIRGGRRIAAEFTWENCVWKTLLAFRKETD